MSMSPDEIDDVVKAARRALQGMQFSRACELVDEIRYELDFPAVRPMDRRSGSWVLDVIRIELFVRLERDEVPAAKDLLNEVVFLHDPDAPEDAVPRVARLWAKGWQSELDGDPWAAYAHRHIACRDVENLAGALELATQQRYLAGDRTEASLLIDCFTDWVRSVRQLRPPIGAHAFLFEQFAESFRNERHPIRELLRRRAELERNSVSVWSYRRAYARLGFEAADRGTPEGAKQAQDFLSNANFAIRYRQDVEGDELAMLERDLIWAELDLAKEEPHDPQKVTAHKTEADQMHARHGLTRRADFLDTHWEYFLRAHTAHRGGGS